ncbi:MAG: hypothetical protein RLP44_27180 [Aggregatilineales bacterium]
MIISQQVDVKIISRFDELINRTQKLINSNHDLKSMMGFETQSHIEFTEIQTSTETLVELLFGKGDRRKRLVEDVSKKASTRAGSEGILGILRGLKSDYEAGLLQSLSQMIEANLASDYMGQAEQLLGEGVSGQHDYVPAAVLAGAVLENSLRTLCQRHSPPIDTVKPNGVKKTLDPLITDLQKANVFNTAKAAQLKSWAKTRNSAAHGEFTEFNRKDVEAMILGVKNFIADYL